MNSVKWPRKTEPLASRRSRVDQYLRRTASPKKIASAAAVTGPMCAIQPVMHANSASSRERGVAASSRARAESNCASGKNAVNCCSSLRSDPIVRRCPRIAHVQLATLQRPIRQSSRDHARIGAAQTVPSANAVAVSAPFRKRDQGLQHIVQFIGIAHIRPSLFANFRNRRRIEPADFREHRLRAACAASRRRERAVLPEERHPDRRTDSHSEFRAKIATARAYPQQRSESLPVAISARTAFSPSTSIASVSASFIASRTSG